MRNRIMGAIGILWGGACVVNWLLGRTATTGSSAYQAGHSAAVAFGALLLVVGLVTFFKQPGD